MDPATVTRRLAESAPRAAAIWQSWLESTTIHPEDPDETLAAFARFLLGSSERAENHPRIIGSALSAVAAVLPSR
jgi:hypothetical protein